MTHAAALVTMAMAYQRSSVLCAAAQLGIADAFAGREQTVAELAQSCGADAESLYRLLRALASIGVVAESTPRSFVLTPLGEPLRREAPDSVWPVVVFWSDLLADNWSCLADCVRTGNSAPAIMRNAGIASRWTKNPEAGAIFRAVMGTAAAEDYMSIVDACDFAGRRVIADLGGGGGGLIIAVLKRHHELRGMLVDRQASIDSATPRFATEGFSERCQLIAADLSESVPGGADVYVMKHVLHGYTDDAAVSILKNCRAVIPSDGRLLIVEFVLPDFVSHADPALEPRLLSDLNMLAVTGGKERSTREWTTLLATAGFDVRSVTPVLDESAGQGMAVIEAAPCISE